ncbi:lipoprotein, partial [Sedimentibacter sp.]
MKKLLIFILAVFMLASCSEKTNQVIDPELEKEEDIS